MTNDQIRALEGLYTAAHGKYGTLVDLTKVQFTISGTTLDDLRQQQLIRMAGRGGFTLTMRGKDKAIENRLVPPVDC